MLTLIISDSRPKFNIWNYFPPWPISFQGGVISFFHHQSNSIDLNLRESNFSRRTLLCGELWGLIASDSSIESHVSLRVVLLDLLTNSWLVHCRVTASSDTLRSPPSPPLSTTSTPSRPPTPRGASGSCPSEAVMCQFAKSAGFIGQYTQSISHVVYTDVYVCMLHFCLVFDDLWKRQFLDVTLM